MRTREIAEPALQGTDGSRTKPSVSGERVADLDDRPHEQVEILPATAVVGDGDAQSEATIQHGVGRDGDAGDPRPGSVEMVG